MSDEERNSDVQGSKLPQRTQLLTTKTRDLSETSEQLGQVDEGPSLQSASTLVSEPWKQAFRPSSTLLADESGPPDLSSDATTIGGRYELGISLGEGAMGLVKEAYDQTLKRKVAVKLMSPRLLASEGSRERFAREAQALANLSSDHIVGVFDYGIHERAPYIVMERLEGESLAKRLEREGQLPLPEVIKLIEQIADGLTTASEKDIVHRDLKPANVFMAASNGRETAKLLDFGLAWVRSNSRDQRVRFAGTPRYMSPEQMRARQPELADDLWALAVLAYKALTGAYPFQKRTLPDLIVAICTDPFDPPSIHAPDLAANVDDFFKRALAKSPAQRFTSITEFVHAFRALRYELPPVTILVVDDEPDARDLFRRRFRRNMRKKIYEVFFVEDGVQALEQLEQHDIDIMLADINMPKMDGLTLLQKLPEVSPHTKTVMVSAYGEMGNIRRAMNAGAWDFVVKPIDLEDLGMTIEKLRRWIAEQRDREKVDKQLAFLKKFTNATVRARSEALPHGAMQDVEQSEMTAAVIRVAGFSETALGPAAAMRVRELNANFDVIMPEVLAHDGIVDNIVGDTALTIFKGEGHLEQAIAACVEISRQLESIATTARSESAYSHGLSIGLAEGRAAVGYLGSNICGRLSLTILGEMVATATRLAAVAAPGELLLASDMGERALAVLHDKALTLEPREVEQSEAVWSVRWNQQR